MTQLADFYRVDNFIDTFALGHYARGVPPDATYLAWIDARLLGHDNPAAHFEREAGLFLSDGAHFGWPGWLRFNFGCPRQRMLEGLEKLRGAL